MVKSAKLWREIHRQYATLAELGGDDAEEVQRGRRAHAASSGSCVSPTVSSPAPERSKFYKDGFRHRHYVLILCASMVLCEWMDRSILSIAMQSIQKEFRLTDAQTGLMASASLWLVPFAVTVLGRIADHVPKATMLGFGVMGWGICTMMTGMSQSYRFLIFSRLLAGLSNCAGYPVAVSLIAEFFNPREMTTAIGYFNAGCQVGGLLGMGLGGAIITHLGWRIAFLAVSAPQIVLAVLLMTTVRNKKQPVPKRSWCKDVHELFSIPSFRFIVLAAFVHGIMSGNFRFILSFVQRGHHLSAEIVGLSFGLSSGLVGVFAAGGGGHLLDRICQRLRDHRGLLWSAAVGNALRLVFMSLALTSSRFGVLILFYSLDNASHALLQGVDTTVQMLGQGRRGTTQALMELCWAIGMGLGPYLGGVLSDFLRDDFACDSSCSLGQSLLIILGFCFVGQGVCYLLASASLRDDVTRVKTSLAAATAGPPAASPSGSEAPDLRQESTREIKVEVDDEVSDGDIGAEAAAELDEPSRNVAAGAAVRPVQGEASSPDPPATAIGRPAAD